jgi:hypothetical protein
MAPTTATKTVITIRCPWLFVKPILPEAGLRVGFKEGAKDVTTGSSAVAPFTVTDEKVLVDPNFTAAAFKSVKNSGALTSTATELCAALASVIVSVEDVK